MRRKPKVGQRVRVIEVGAGTVSGKRGTVFVPRTNNRGIPEIPGEYKPMGRDDVAVQFDDGDAIVLDRRYLNPDDLPAPREHKGVHYWASYRNAAEAIERLGVHDRYPNARIVETLRGYAIQLYTSGPYLPLTGDEKHSFAREGDIVPPYATNPRSREIGQHVHDYASAVKFLGNKERRRLANNTEILKVGDTSGDRFVTAIGVKLHGTVVVAYYPDGSIRLNSGGYRTRTTLQRINQLLPPGLGVYQKNFDWYVQLRGKGVIPFEDGMRINEFSEPPDEKPRQNPGKFSDTVEELLYVIDHDQSMGSVHERGWYGLVSGLTMPEAKDVVEIHDIDMQEFLEDAKQYDWPLNAIVGEDDQGNIEVRTFKSNREAIALWRELERGYNL